MFHFVRLCRASPRIPLYTRLTLLSTYSVPGIALIISFDNNPMEIFTPFYR